MLYLDPPNLCNQVLIDQKDCWYGNVPKCRQTWKAIISPRDYLIKCDINRCRALTIFRILINRRLDPINVKKGGIYIRCDPKAKQSYRRDQNIWLKVTYTCDNVDLFTSTYFIVPLNKHICLISDKWTHVDMTPCLVESWQASRS